MHIAPHNAKALVSALTHVSPAAGTHGNDANNIRHLCREEFRALRAFA